MVVGFAAESENLIAHAQQKLERKGLDLIIANDITAEGIGFNSDNNAVTVIDQTQATGISPRSKQQLARELIRLIAEKLNKQ